MPCHVALDSTVLQEAVGGIHAFTVNVIRRLTGVRFSILHDRPLQIPLPAHCVTVKVDSWSGRHWLKRQRILPGVLKRLGYPVYWQPANFGVPMLTSSKVLLTVHDAIPLSWEPYHLDRPRPRRDKFWYTTTMQTELWRADAITTDSVESRRNIAKFFRVDPTKVHVVPMGVDLEPCTGAHAQKTLAQRGLVPGGYLLSHGGLNRRKNIERLVEAYARIHDSPSIRPLTLVMTGDVHSLPLAVTSLVLNRGIEQKVAFTGRVSPEEMQVLVRHARAIVYPTLAEGFGLPLLEGMAAGLPVVCSRIPVLQELGQEFPVYVDPDSVESIADGMLQAVATSHRVDDAQMRRGMARAREFSWDRTASEMERLMRALS